MISHAGILVPFFLGILSSYWVYEEYAAAQTPFLPFALFIGISMSITAFPVLARIIQERNMTKTPLGTLTIASAAFTGLTSGKLKDAGIKKGFIIMIVNNQKISAPEDLEKIVESILQGRTEDQGLFIKGFYPNGRTKYYAIDLAE